MEELSLWGLFLSSFISSTILPGGSEVLLVYLLNQSEFGPVELLIAASAGNSFGGVLTYAMGWWIASRWPLKVPKKKRQKQAVILVRRYGVLSLLFSWLPLIGDPLCLAAGWIRCHLFISLMLICVGKTLRYSLIVLAVS